MTTIITTEIMFIVIMCS